jgi:putative endonuclease
MCFYVYILKSNRSRHYIGFTSNLSSRIIKHNCKHNGFTATTEHWKVEIYEEVATKTEAMQMERKLKSFKNYRRAIAYLKKIGGSVG